MTIEERQKITREFLEDLDKQGSIGKINLKILNDEYTRNFPPMIEGVGNVFDKIIDHHVNGKTNFQVSNEDVTIFVCFCSVSLVNAFLEFIKKMLLMPIPRKETASDRFLTYGDLIHMLTSKLKFDKTKSQIIRKNFFVGYRNAISHIDYSITGDGISFKIDGQKIHHTMDEFNDIMFEIKAVADTILEFVNNKVSELDKKATALESEARDLTQRAEHMKEMIRLQREATAEVRHETGKIINNTKRKERKTYKIQKNTELIERAKKRDTRNNAKIVSKL